jgi:hypothetical protein
VRDRPPKRLIFRNVPRSSGAAHATRREATPRTQDERGRSFLRSATQWEHSEHSVRTRAFEARPEQRVSSGLSIGCGNDCDEGASPLSEPRSASVRPSSSRYRYRQRGDAHDAWRHTKVVETKGFYHDQFQGYRARSEGKGIEPHTVSEHPRGTTACAACARQANGW